MTTTIGKNKPQFVIGVETTHRAGGATLPRIQQILTHIAEQQKVNGSWFVVVVGHNYQDESEFESFCSLIAPDKAHFVNLKDKAHLSARAATIGHALELCYSAQWTDCIYVHATDEMAWDTNHLESLKTVYDDSKATTPQASFVSTIALDNHAQIPSSITPVHWSKFSAVPYFDSNWHKHATCAVSLRVADFSQQALLNGDDVLTNISNCIVEQQQQPHDEKKCFLVRHITAVRTMGIQLDSCEWHEHTEFLAIINFHHGNIEWRNKLKMPFVIFTKDTPEREPYNARNKAKSETNLLKFAYEFYDQLPQNIIYVHQYEYKWHHTGSIADILNSGKLREQFKQSKTRGYYNFNTWLLEPAKEKVERMLQSGWWQACMQPYFGDVHEYHDFTLKKRGCAQFVVSRERIRSLPREFYKNMYDWLVANSTGTGRGVPHQSPLDNFYTSRYLEWVWELIFTVHKPSENAFVNLCTVNGTTTSIRALYGADSYLVDVTHLFIDTFYSVDSKKISIDAHTRLNYFFGDVVCNTVKRLQISVKKITTTSNSTWHWFLPEASQYEFCINLENLQ